jgi:hypothetical protein
VVWSRKTKLYLFTQIALIILTFASLTFGQAVYSDAWIDETNKNTDGEGAFLVGRGVSEINYVDEEGVEVVTKLTSPNGRIVTSRAFGQISAQADARMPWDWEDFVGNFTVSIDRFSMCQDGWMLGDDGILMTHGYNPGGGIWWYPTGWIRCPRTPMIVSQVVPIGVSFVAMQLVLSQPNPPPDGYWLYEKVVPCDVYCNAPQINRKSGGPHGCIYLQIPFGPLGCSTLVRVVPAQHSCVCYDVGWN